MGRSHPTVCGRLDRQASAPDGCDLKLEVLVPYTYASLSCGAPSLSHHPHQPETRWGHATVADDIKGKSKGRQDHIYGTSKGLDAGA